MFRIQFGLHADGTVKYYGISFIDCEPALFVTRISSVPYCLPHHYVLSLEPWNPVMISSSSVHIFQEVPITITARLCLSLNHLLASPLTVYTCVEV